MKKIIIVFSVFYALGIGATNPVQALEMSNSIESSEIQPRTLVSYKFNNVPPKKFNGKTLVTYEYIESGGYYIGWYI